jgi:hypothetical protein
MEGAVICDANPLGQPNGFRLNLTQPLPYDQPALQGEYAWMLELVDGTICTFMGGATVAFGDQRVNFGCSDNWVILGQPNPGQIWTVQKVLLSSDWTQIRNSMQVQVKTVWK